MGVTPEPARLSLWFIWSVCWWSGSRRKPRASRSRSKLRGNNRLSAAPGTLPGPRQPVQGISDEIVHPIIPDIRLRNFYPSQLEDVFARFAYDMSRSSQAH